jgi:hypothetical protein
LYSPAEKACQRLPGGSLTVVSQLEGGRPAPRPEQASGRRDEQDVVFHGDGQSLDQHGA